MSLSVTAVRRAEPEDLDVVGAIEAVARGGSPRGVRSGAERVAEGTLLVIGQPVIGFAHVLPGDPWRLVALHVHPDAHGVGIGTTLLHAVYGVVLDAGGDAVLVGPDPAAASWFEREGFTPQSSGEWRRPVVDEPVPVPAVSVLPVRDGDSGSLEVFVQHRVGSMDFVPNAVVFPGGRVDPEDAEAGAALDLDAELVADHVRAWEVTAHDLLGGGEVAARTLLATALREVEEETGARIDAGALIPWDDWITPIGGPKRFDVRFFLLPVTDPEFGGTFGHTTTEAHHSGWSPVAEVLAGAEDRSLMLVAPTRVLVDELARIPDTAAAAALRPPVVPVHHDLCPPGPRRDRLVAAKDPTSG
ncbi:MAG: GNAT family N-acetyltransferase [Mobilicoccus sp.]|nr:GNAT family N-acetyltransferase [Mobilicoccus sp.]